MDKTGSILKFLSVSIFLLLPVFTQLHNVLSGAYEQYLKIMGALPFLFLIFVFLVKKLLDPKTPLISYASSTHHVFFAFFMALIFLCYCHGAVNQTIDFDGLVYRLFWLLCFFAIFFVINIVVEDPLQLASLILLSAVLIVLANTFLFFLDVAGDPLQEFTDRTVVRKAMMASMFGFEIERARFSLASGVNSFGMVACISFLVGWFLFFRKNVGFSQRLPMVIVMLLSLVAIFCVDSRASLLMCVFGAVVFPIMFFLLRGRIAYLTIIIPFLPIFLVLFLQLFGGEFGQFMSRDGSEASNLSARGIIWTLSLQKLSDLDIMDFVGYGLYGQKTAEVSTQFVNFGFGRIADFDLISLHNSYLQMIFDVGYIGFAVFMLVNYFAVVKLVRLWDLSGSHWDYILLCVFFAFLVYGTIEVVMTPYHEAFPFYLFILMYAFFVNSSKNERLDLAV